MAGRSRLRAALTAAVLVGGGYAWGHFAVADGLFPQPQLRAVKQALTGTAPLPFPPAYHARAAMFAASGQATAPADIVFIGDSITAAVEWQEAFPGQRVLNRAIPFDTIGGIRARLDAIVATQARSAVIMAGVNDVLRGHAPDAIIADYVAVIDVLRAAGMAVHVQTILPCAADWPGCARFLPVIEALNRDLLALDSPGVDVIDTASALRDGRELRTAYSYDGLHLSAAGVTAWQSLLRQHLTARPSRPPRPSSRTAPIPAA